MAAKKDPPVESAVPVAPADTTAPLAEVLRHKSTAPIVENGREWAYGKIPYYVDGVRVTREEYVVHQREQLKQATREELAAAVAVGVDVPPIPPADSATSKE